ncbi:MAG: C4-dicarboxylate TRAP transporter substrate-binding protein [Spirochaetaceae bacterium]|jgi:tripartite ATP-independent transporter DctP family solute receptor|nr:C4-dicarboxylate TRAP transporter substrate-binding protein [Spirochaetaceae bacterium]
MKKFILVSFALAALIAAGNVWATGEAQSGGGTAGTVKPVVIQIGYENNPGEPVDLAIHEWKRLIEERSKGSMKVDIFPSSQLGSKNEIIDQMLAGMNVITLADGAFYADRGVPDLGITFGPYLFASWDEAWKLTKSDWWKTQMKIMEGKGLKVLTANWIYGDRHTLAKRPIRQVSDFRGLKIRVPNNLIQVKGLEVMGATPTPLPLGDVYTALQQGVVDGLENPLPVLYNGKFHEVAKYLTLDAHVKNFTTWLCGIAFFNSLTPEQQNILTQTGDEAGLFNNRLQENLTAETLAKFKADGVEIIEIDIVPFQNQAKQFYSLPDFTSRWSPGLYDTVSRAKVVN